MNKKDKAFVIGAIAVCLILAVLSPFIASSNPDGLENRLKMWEFLKLNPQLTPHSKITQSED